MTNRRRQARRGRPISYPIQMDRTAAVGPGSGEASRVFPNRSPRQGSERRLPAARLVPRRGISDRVVASRRCSASHRHLRQAQRLPLSLSSSSRRTSRMFDARRSGRRPASAGLVVLICTHALTLALRRPGVTDRTLPAVIGLSQQSGPCRGLAGPRRPILTPAGRCRRPHGVLAWYQHQGRYR
jgi:hypothetical protein